MDIKNEIFKLFYKALIRRLLFLIDPEKTHELALRAGSLLGRLGATRWLVKICFDYKHPGLKQNIFALEFKNPIGLAGGFDKNGYLTGILPEVGFGFMEIGSVSGKECLGNPKPRMWRLPKAKALQINYGMPNEGCKKIHSRLSKKSFSIPLGVNIAKTNISEFDDVQKGIEDYKKVFQEFKGMASYVTINISCPATVGGRPFEEPENFKKLMDQLSSIENKKPVLLKFSPDLPEHQLQQILDIALEYNVKGFICSNLSKDKIKNLNPKNPKGGVSGKAIEDLVNNQIKFVYNKVKGRAIVVGCGGVFSAEDAYKKIKLGASLIQIITGMIYEGPQLIGEINRGLVELMRKDGYRNISEAIGADNR